MSVSFEADGAETGETAQASFNPALFLSQMYDSAKSNNTSKFVELFQKGVSVDYTDKTTHWSCLDWGVFNSNEIIVETILREKSSIKISDEQRTRVSVWASYRGCLTIFMVLLHSDCIDWNARDDVGNSLLHLAASCGHQSLVEFLLKSYPHESTVMISIKNSFNNLPIQVSHSNIISSLLHNFPSNSNSSNLIQSSSNEDQISSDIDVVRRWLCEGLAAFASSCSDANINNRAISSSLYRISQLTPNNDYQKNWRDVCVDGYAIMTCLIQLKAKPCVMSQEEYSTKITPIEVKLLHIKTCLPLALNESDISNLIGLQQVTLVIHRSRACYWLAHLIHHSDNNLNISALENSINRMSLFELNDELNVLLNQAKMMLKVLETKCRAVNECDRILGHLDNCRSLPVVGHLEVEGNWIESNNLTVLREKLMSLKGLDLVGLGDVVTSKVVSSIRLGEEQMGAETAKDDSDKKSAIAAMEAAKKPKKPKKK